MTAGLFVPGPAQQELDGFRDATEVLHLMESLPPAEARRVLLELLDSAGDRSPYGAGVQRAIAGRLLAAVRRPH